MNYSAQDKENIKQLVKWLHKVGKECNYDVDKIEQVVKAFFNNTLQQNEVDRFLAIAVEPQ